MFKGEIVTIVRRNFDGEDEGGNPTVSTEVIEIGNVLVSIRNFTYERSVEEALKIESQGSLWFLPHIELQENDLYVVREETWEQAGLPVFAAPSGFTGAPFLTNARKRLDIKLVKGNNNG